MPLLRCTSSPIIKGNVKSLKYQVSFRTSLPISQSLGSDSFSIREEAVSSRHSVARESRNLIQTQFYCQVVFSVFFILCNYFRHLAAFLDNQATFRC